jgi:hypothetical protein
MLSKISDTLILDKTYLYIGFIHEDKKGWILLIKVFEVIFYVDLKTEIGL